MRAASADGVGRPGGEKSGLVSPNEQQEIRGTKPTLAISLHICPCFGEKIDDPDETFRVDN